MGKPLAGLMARRLAGGTVPAAVAGAVVLLLLGAPASGPSLTSGVIGAATGTAAAGTCTATWPMFQHDQSHHAAADCGDINPLTVAGLHPAWFVSTSQPVTSSPVVFDKQVYVGDESGAFYDVAAATGTVRWTFHFPQAARNACGTIDRHNPSYGQITSSAAVARVAGFADGDPTVFFGAGGSLVALDAATGACRWAVDLDPSDPTSPLEVESSPVVFTGNAPGRTPEVIVGTDANESPKQSAPGGLQALDAVTGSLLWKFEPENDQTTTSLDVPTTNPDGSASTASLTDGCGDVWSSPSLDPAAPVGLHTAKGAAVRQDDGLVFTTTGNCPQGLREDPAAPANPKAECANSTPVPDLEGIAALDATTGCLVWRWSEPVNQYSNPALADGGDTDIGASPILTTIPTSAGPTPAVIDGSKSGYMYALGEYSGATLWASQPAQPGQTGAALAGAIGGFIGSSALGMADGKATVFGSTAILAPLAGAGVQDSGPGGLPEATPDTTFLQHPLRAASLHAVDAATGAVRWQALVSLPSYSAVTYADGVVFAPSTTGFSIVAYDADSGVPLWSFPTVASMSSGAAIVGPSVFVGAGTDEAPSVPPQANGIWCFTLGPAGTAMP